MEKLLSPFLKEVGWQRIGNLEECSNILVGKMTLKKPSPHITAIAGPVSVTYRPMQMWINYQVEN